MKGIAYEKAVAAVQAMMDPNSTVEHNMHIPDKDGIKRQFDVVLRGNVGGHKMLVVIECKDEKRKTGVPKIEAFHAKSKSVGANMALFVSRSGFTKTAVTKARAYDIGVLSLVKKDSDEPTQPKADWYMESFAWSQARFTFHFADPSIQLNDFDCAKISYQGHRLLDWWLSKLDENHRLEDGDYEHPLVFSEPREFTIKGQLYSLNGVTCYATRTKEILKKTIPLKMDGFYDWSEGKVKLPPSSSITTGSFLSDFSDWEPHEGPIPEPSGFFDWRLKGFGAVNLPYSQEPFDFEKL
ncbi:MAG: hypothetical protein CML13_09525 [Puniceicoccaceae bacterium]|nr:hypothetical protein [Puniceicoccaceae bacterium]|tara:strand:- start:773 stop:1660 length:888 start_codon:yes stop_codon:yes gene_type:complete